MKLIPAKVDWSDPIATLMAGPNQNETHPLSEDVRNAVHEAIQKLSPKYRFVIEAVYVWGYSYSELADMMGYNSKGAPHYILRCAERNLGSILESDPRINRMMKGEQNMVEQNNWTDGAWKHLRYFDRCSKVHSYDETIYSYYFKELGSTVKTLSSDQSSEWRIYDLCTQIGAEAARGLAGIGQWDMESMLDILARKQHDYGHDNINAFGIVGVAVRISDKIARFNNLTNKGASAQNESLVDTLVDMVGYAVIARMLEDGTFDLPLVWEM